MGICKGLRCAMMKLVKHLKINVGVITAITIENLTSCCFVSLVLLLPQEVICGLQPVFISSACSCC